MKPVRYSLLVIMAVVLTITQTTQAQKNWSLEECIDYALENNINIKRQKVGADQATNNHKQARRNLLPSASANVSHSYNFGKTLNRDIYEYVNQEFQYGDASASTSVTVFDGLRKINTVKKRKYEMLAQLQRIEEARYDVTMNVVTYYLMVLSAMEQKDIREEQLAVTMGQIEQVEQQIQVGKKAKGELLEIKAQAASERADLTAAKNELEMAYVDLTQVMNLDTTGQFTIEMPENLQITGKQNIEPTDSVYSRALSDFPSIQRARYELESARKNLKVTKGTYMPELSFGAGISSYFSSLSEPTYIRQMRDINVRTGLQLSLSIPIFNQFNRRTNVANARLNVEDNQLMLQEQKQNLYKKIQRAHNEARAAFENYQANREALESYQQAFDYAEERYEVGLVDAVEYRIAKNDLARARSNLSQSKFNFIFRLKILEFYMGKAMEI
jgi:outer membrane protein